MNVGIVIPAFNEAARLPRTLSQLQEAIQTKTLNPLSVTDVLVVDDGSTDATASVVASPFRVLKLDQNRGKGAAIRAGIAASSAEWILVADADGSTPWIELLTLYRALQTEKSAKIIIGSRGLKESQLQVRQSWVREHLGKLFNHLIVVVAGLPFRDTQCGFKLIHRPSISAWIETLTVDRFAWDVEFLLEALDRQISVVEVPVTWKHEEGSKVRLFRDGFRMVWDFLKIRVRVALRSRKMGE